MHIDTGTPFNTDEFKELYKTFDSSTVSRLPKLYSAQVRFKDPVHELQGLDALGQYFSGFCNASMDCSFEFVNELVASEQAFFQWHMHYRHPRLHNGKALVLTGGTLIKFNSHIYYHEDFYDMGAMLYQHVPVLGWVVKKINERLVSSI